MVSPLDVSGVQRGFAQQQAVNARNAAIAEQERQRARAQRRGVRDALVGAALGGVVGPAAGLTALQGVGLGAQGFSALRRGDPVGVGTAALGAGSLAQQNAQQAQRQAAIESLQGGIQGFRTPTVPMAGAEGTFEELSPQLQRREAALDVISGLAPLDPGGAASALFEFAEPQQRTARFLSPQEKSAAGLPENAIVQQKVNGNFQVKLPPPANETALEQKIRMLQEANPDLSLDTITNMALGKIRVEIPAQGGTGFFIDETTRKAVPINIPPTTGEPSISAEQALSTPPDEVQSEATIDAAIRELEKEKERLRRMK